MTAVSLTLPGPTVSREVTWEQIEAEILRRGFDRVADTAGGGHRWERPGKPDPSIRRYLPQPNDPRAEDAETGNVVLAVLTLARLDGCAPGEMLAKIVDGAEPAPTSPDQDASAKLAAAIEALAPYLDGRVPGVLSHAVVLGEVCKALGCSRGPEPIL